MSSVGEIKRQLDSMARAIAALDAELSAGRVSADDHARQRAERERELGRLYLILREVQRDTRAETSDPVRREPPRAPVTWWRHPAMLASAAALILIAGAGAAVVFTRWSAEPARPAIGSGAPLALPAGAGSSAPEGGSAPMDPIELQALRLATTRDDAPVDKLLRLAHIDLDAGRLDQARALYDRVLVRDPKNAEALTHQGSILYQEGRIDEALAKVETALGIDPSYIHAHWDRVQYLFHGKRDFAAAVKAGEAFLTVVPDGPDADNVRRLIAEARKNSGTR